ncbi:MAG: glycosyltransferase [Oscillospiraceae bacterium]|nr:glycosyltransferase [Oscillospiraceae bacterium]
MKIVYINSVNYGSTGKIMLGISEVASRHKISVFTFSQASRTQRRGIKNHFFIGTIIERYLCHKINSTTGFNGTLNIIGTFLLISKLKRINPDIIHIHNLHNNFVNISILFNYIKKNNIPIVWTLHDCWSFTGQCPYFTLAKCDKWKTVCYDCSQYREYPAASVDRTKIMWQMKRKWFTGIKNMTIITPSQWLADLVMQSYLKDYPVKVINNGIDLNLFKPTEDKLRDKYHITAKYIVLGAASGWGIRKGFDVFLKLAQRLDKNYQIVLVGTDDNTDKKLPANIISIHKTQNQQELAEIYSAANVFANPTREENYPTVNMESIACGTPVVTFRTGGSPEILDETCGSIVPCDDIDAFEKEIRRVCNEKPFSKEACLNQAKAQFDMNDRFEEYIELYKLILKQV